MTEKNAENAEQFVCEKCDYMCHKKSDWTRHISTRKHQSSDGLVTAVTEKSANHTCTNCHKEYKSRNGIWKHNKTCNSTTQTIIKPNIDTPEVVIEDKNKIIEILVKENMEYKNIFSIFIKEILSKKSIEEFLKKK